MEDLAKVGWPCGESGYLLLLVLDLVINSNGEQDFLTGCGVKSYWRCMGIPFSPVTVGLCSGGVQRGFSTSWWRSVGPFVWYRIGHKLWSPYGVGLSLGVVLLCKDLTQWWYHWWTSPRPHGGISSRRFYICSGYLVVCWIVRRSWLWGIVGGEFGCTIWHPLAGLR